ncbi:hypothetical protein AS149_25945 [Burkholderia cenocepacia]|nr:hypothetical protein AS149_25945 [Burkholderia cenocepacia]
MAAALSMTAAGAYATDTGPASPAEAIVAPVQQEASIAPAPALSTKLQRSPNSCGGVPAPRLLPADGYFTVCVNDRLRFVNSADQYHYSFVAIRLQDGKEVERSGIEGVSQLGMPVQWSTGTETPYLASLKVDNATGKTTATSETVFSGVTLFADAATRRPDGTLVADVAVDDTSLIKLDTLAHVPGYPPIQGAHTRAVSIRETLALAPGQPTILRNGNLEVRLTATKVMQ